MRHVPDNFLGHNPSGKLCHYKIELLPLHHKCRCNCIKNVNIPIKIIYTTLPHNLIKDKLK